jgi:uncharacterized protein (TIGR02145 family)
MNILKFGVAVMALLMVTSCVQEEVETRKSGFVDPSSVVKGTMMDSRDGKTYKTVTIGDQIWMAENMAFKVGNSPCYQNKEKNCRKYGRYYDWKSAMKACPSGWRLPSKDDFDKLVVSVISEPLEADSWRLRQAKERILIQMLNSKKGWYKNGNGLDLYGFSAVPAGDVTGNGEGGFRFRLMGYGTYFWSSSNSWNISDSHDFFSLYYTVGGSYENEVIGFFNYPDDAPLSVRCVRDK